LDEVRVAGVALEQVVAHGDELDRGAAAGFQVAGDAVHERGPVRAPERFDHLDADDRVEPADDVAIVLLAEIHAGMVRAGPGELLVGKADRGRAAAARGEMARQRTPAAADLEQRLRLAEPLGETLPLAPLRGLEPVARYAIRARVAHRRI